MDIYVLNKQFDEVAVIDAFVSVIWTTRYFTSGDFELYLQAEEGLLDVLQDGFYLVREADKAANGIMRNVMIIENREIVTDAENGDNLIITGRCLKSSVEPENRCLNAVMLKVVPLLPWFFSQTGC
jgi:hypothetical protein